ncbi:Mitochondrial inner membrane protease atp23 [Trichinella pseudospiralis]|uniref:Mitochondrial inner membrane protease ATP23 n=2 Tax=Trichinella pseudospiralis TaxID=6337 RepID=A0A0V1FSD8_TRIPS|nr:Mitochondrial inner membrane protease atp23 [Trichinella pseudospiralis]
MTFDDGVSSKLFPERGRHEFTFENSTAKASQTKRADLKSTAQKAMQSTIVVIILFVVAILEIGILFYFQFRSRDSESHLVTSSQWLIIICIQDTVDEKNVLRAMGHELIHMFDSCRARFDLSNIENLICSEIRAAHLINCRPAHPSFKDSSHLYFYDFKDCIRRLAVNSVCSLTGISENEAKILIEKSMDRCCSDTEPFCKLYRNYY